MQNILLTLDNFKHPEYFYLFIALGLGLIIVSITIQRKRNKRIKYLNIVKIFTFLLLIAVISIPQKQIVKAGKQQTQYNRLYYIDSSPEYFKECIEILSEMNPTRYDPIILRLGKKYILKLDQLEEIEKVNQDNIEGKPQPSFVFMETDISLFCIDAFVKKLIVIGKSQPAKQQIDQVLRYCDSLEFIPLQIIAPHTNLRFENINIQSNKLSIDHPFSFECTFNKNPESTINARILVNDELKSSHAISDQSFNTVIDGISEVGLHKFHFEADGLSFTKNILVQTPKRIFILRGNTKSEQQSDNFLINYAKISNVDASLLSKIPDDLYNFNSGFMRLSQFLMLDEIERKSLEEWVAKGAGLFISYGEDIQLWNNQLDEYKNFLPAEPVLLNEPENSDNTSVEETDQDSLVARVSILLMIDNSGSMAADIGGISRFEYVKAAAKKMVENLDPEDHIGICSFNSEVTVVLPLIPARNKELIYRKIDNIKSPAMQTSIRKACDSAINVFSKDRSAVKQFLLLSDGEETIETEYNFQITRDKLIEAEINTSVIGFGEYNPEMLASLVTKGGRFYFQSREKDSQGFYIHKLPEFILSDVKLAKDNLKNNFKESESSKDDFTDTNKALPQVIKTGNFPSFWLFNVFSDNNIKLKNILRFVEMYNFKRCYTILGLNFDGVDFPLLSARNYQRGKVLAFACDFNPEYIPDWFNWDEFHLFFMQLTNFMNSQSYEGIEHVGSEFGISEDSLIVDTNLFTNNPEFNLDDIKIYAVYKNSQEFNPESKEIIQNNSSNKVIRTKFNINIFEDTENLILEYKSTIFDIINIPESMRIKVSTDSTKQKIEETMKLSFQSNIKQITTSRTTNETDLTLITILLLVTLFVYLFDVYLRR